MPLFMPDTTISGIQSSPNMLKLNARVEISDGKPVVVYVGTSIGKLKCEPSLVHLN